MPHAGAMSPFPLLDDLPAVEAQATRLDGESYRLGEAYLPIGVRPQPATRAAAALGARSPRLVAALGTAAWVWGARPEPPTHGEYLVDLAARWRPQLGEGLSVMESVLQPGDVVRWGRWAVTSPLRTVLDLARFRIDFAADEAAAVRGLAGLGGFGLVDVLAALDRTRNLSGKRRAATRLRSALSPS